MINGVCNWFDLLGSEWVVVELVEFDVQVVDVCGVVKLGVIVDVIVLWQVLLDVIDGLKYD